MDISVKLRPDTNKVTPAIWCIVTNLQRKLPKAFLGWWSTANCNSTPGKQNRRVNTSATAMFPRMKFVVVCIERVRFTTAIKRTFPGKPARTTMAYRTTNIQTSVKFVSMKILFASWANVKFSLTIQLRIEKLTTGLIIDIVGLHFCTWLTKECRQKKLLHLRMMFLT